MRTVAEQEEPEYEPRADTIRGGAGILRALSTVRTQRQVEEAKRIHEDHMHSIGENDEYEWDGLRRRKTVSSNGGSISRRKTVHPPLGMSRFPDEISEPDSEVHPGFFGRIGRKSHTTAGGQSERRARHSPVPLSNVRPSTSVEDHESQPREHVYGLPAGLQKSPEDHGQDTSYKGAASTGGPHIHFAGDGASDARERASSRGSSLAPPRPPPHTHGNRRQFSFQNVFHRRRDGEENAGGDDARPVSRGALSFASRTSNREYPTAADTTEEERLGLVQGDSSKSLPKYSELSEDDPDARDSDEWQVTSGHSSSPEQVGVRLVGGGDLGRRGVRDNNEYADNDDDDLYNEPLRIPISREADGRRSGR